MLLSQFLSNATSQLSKAGIDSSRLDVLVLLEDVLETNRANLLAHPEYDIPSKQAASLQTLIDTRATHIPLAYIRGKAPFYGRDFYVDTNVLVPRPETEAMIEQLLRLDLPDSPTLADIGTGSGCIGITAALELPTASVILCDLSTKALAVATKNAQHYNVSVQTRRQDLLADMNEHVDALLANLPYVPDGYAINDAARHEPELALFSGEDGLDHFRILWQQIGDREQKPAYVLTESLESQHAPLAELAKKAGYNCVASDTLIQVFAR